MSDLTFNYSYTVGRCVTVTNSNGFSEDEIRQLLEAAANYNEDLDQASFMEWIVNNGYDANGDDMSKETRTKAMGVRFMVKDVHREITVDF